MVFSGGAGDLFAAVNAPHICYAAVDDSNTARLRDGVLTREQNYTRQLIPYPDQEAPSVPEPDIDPATPHGIVALLRWKGQAVRSKLRCNGTFHPSRRRSAVAKRQLHFEGTAGLLLTQSRLYMIRSGCDSSVSLQDCASEGH